MKASEYIADAICLVDKVKTSVKAGDLLTHQEVIDLLTLMTQVRELRDKMIQCDLESGMLGKEAATKYNLSASSISQIKLRGQQQG